MPAHRFGPRLREPQVVLLGTPAVGMPPDFDADLRVLHENGSERAERGQRGRKELCAVELEDDVHGADELSREHCALDFDDVHAGDEKRDRGRQVEFEKRRAARIARGGIRRRRRGLPSRRIGRESFGRHGCRRDDRNDDSRRSGRAGAAGGAGRAGWSRGAGRPNETGEPRRIGLSRIEGEEIFALCDFEAADTLVEVRAEPRLEAIDILACQAFGLGCGFGAGSSGGAGGGFG